MPSIVNELLRLSLLNVIENKCKLTCASLSQHQTRCEHSPASLQQLLTLSLLSADGSDRFLCESVFSYQVASTLKQVKHGKPWSPLFRMSLFYLISNKWTHFQINKCPAWRSWPAWWRSWRQTSGDTNQSNSCWDSHRHKWRFMAREMEMIFFFFFLVWLQFIIYINTFCFLFFSPFISYI